MQVATPASYSSDQSPGARLCWFLEKHERLFLFLFAVGFFASSLLLSHRKPFWFDETFTMLVATRPTLAALMNAMPADGNPPLLHLIIRGLVPILGPTTLAGRLPCMIGYTAGCLLVYAFVRRHCGIPLAFLALGIAASAPGWDYAFEARPYGLLFGFMMLTLFCWQGAAERKTRRGWLLAGMAAGIAGTTLSHQIGLTEIGFILLCGEAWRAYRTRTFDWPLYATFLVLIPVAAITVPMMLNTRHQLLVAATDTLPHPHVLSPNGWYHKGRGFTRRILGAAPLILAIPLIASLRQKSRPARGESNLPQFEVVAAVACTLLYPITLVGLMVVTNYWEGRYVLIVIAGLAILTAFAFRRWLPESSGLVGGLIVVCAVLFAGDAALIARAQHPVVFPVQVPTAQLPIVTADSLAFYPTWWYADPEQKDRLYYLYDNASPLNRPDEFAVAEKSVYLERDNFPPHAERFGEFVSTHDHFLTFEPGSELSARLTAAGFALTPVQNPGKALFDVSKKGLAP